MMHPICQTAHTMSLYLLYHISAKSYVFVLVIWYVLFYFYTSRPMRTFCHIFVWLACRLTVLLLAKKNGSWQAFSRHITHTWGKKIWRWKRKGRVHTRGISEKEATARPSTWLLPVISFCLSSLFSSFFSEPIWLCPLVIFQKHSVFPLYG